MRQVWRAAPTACDVAYNPPPLPSAPPVTDLNYLFAHVDNFQINQYGYCPPLQCAELAHCGQELCQLVLQSSPFDDVEQPLGRWLAHTHLLQILRLDILKMLHPRNLQLISDSNKELFQLDLKSEIVKFAKGSQDRTWSRVTCCRRSSSQSTPSSSIFKELVLAGVEN